MLNEKSRNKIWWKGGKTTTVMRGFEIEPHTSQTLGTCSSVYSSSAVKSTNTRFHIHEYMLTLFTYDLPQNSVILKQQYIITSQ